jgi:hypothetical protein
MAHCERNNGVELMARTGKLLARAWRRRGIVCRHMGCRWYLSHTISFNDPTRRCQYRLQYGGIERTILGYVRQIMQIALNSDRLLANRSIQLCQKAEYQAKQPHNRVPSNTLAILIV